MGPITRAGPTGSDAVAAGWAMPRHQHRIVDLALVALYLAGGPLQVGMLVYTVQLRGLYECEIDRPGFR